MKLKTLAAKILTSAPVSQIVSWRVGNRINFRGVTVDLLGAPVLPSTKASMFFRLYESAECRFVEQYLLPDVNCIELGASFGALSSLITSRLAPGRRFVAVEAHPDLIETLWRNIRTNGGHLRPDVLHGAISYPPSGSVSFFIAPATMSSRLVPRGGERLVQVPAVSLSRAMRDFADEPFQLVMDIEGGELGILRHEPERLHHCIRMIAEFHRVGDVTVTDLVKMIESTGMTKLDSYGNVFVFTRGQ